MNRKRILFVDDEIAVLEGLQNLLRKERQRWDMVFAVGAEQALTELDRAPVDVVVSDMRMPGMDGIALLAKVKEEHPGTVRFVLSGHAERDAVLRALAVAHQFLSKPCEADALRVAIERTCDLQRLLENEAISRVVGKLDKLPSPPHTYSELTEAASKPNVGIMDIARIVQRDPAISIKVLQLVNSAYFGFAKRVSSIDRAVSYLGIELVKGLTLTAQVFAAMEARPIEGFSLERIQSNSILTARLAKRFLSDPKRGEEAFTAGLVHDVGRIVIALGLPSQLAAVVREARASGKPFHVVEEALIGVTHAEVGAYLLGVWGLPFSIVESVAYHHRPSAVGEGACDVLAAVHAADALPENAGRGECDVSPEGMLDEAFLERAGFSSELPRWRALAEQEVGDASRAA